MAVAAPAAATNSLNHPAGAAPNPSTAAQWPALQRAIRCERHKAAQAAQHPATAALFEFLLFGIKQAWACLFGGAMLAVLLLTHWFYPADAPL